MVELASNVSANLRGFTNPNRYRRGNGHSLWPLLILLNESDNGHSIPELVSLTGWTVGRVRGPVQTHLQDSNSPYIEQFARDKRPLGRFSFRYRITEHGRQAVGVIASVYDLTAGYNDDGIWELEKLLDPEEYFKDGA